MNQTQDAREANQAKTSKKAPPALLLIFFTVFIDLVGFGLIIPVMPTYAQQFKATAFQVGLLIASYSFMQFLFTPFWGRLSDKVGRKPILIISLAASAVGYAIWGFSHSLVMLFASRLLAGTGNANIAVAQAYVADVTTPETRAKGMGAVGAAFGLGFVLGPAIGGFLVGKGHGLEILGFAASALSLCDLILTLIFLPEPEKRSHAGEERFSLSKDFYFETIKSERLRTSLLIFLISTFAFANMEATLVLFTQDKLGFDPMANSIMFTYIGILIVFVQGGMIHRLSKKYGEKKLIAVGTLLLALGLIAIPFVANKWLLALPLALLAIGSGIATPSNQSILSKLAPQERMGGVLGIGQSLSTLGRILGPAIGGFLYGALGMFSPYILGAVTMLVAFFLSLKLPELQSAPKA